MLEQVEKLWPELAWISDDELRDSVRKTWVRALEDSPLEASDLEEIPFTLLIPGCPATFMEHKRCVVHIARRSAEAMDEFLGRALPIDMDVVVAGAILAGFFLVVNIDPQFRIVPQFAELTHPKL